MKQLKLWALATIFCICGACVTTCCTSSNDNPVDLVTSCCFLHFSKVKYSQIVHFSIFFDCYSLTKTGIWALSTLVVMVWPPS